MEGCKLGTGRRLAAQNRHWLVRRCRMLQILHVCHYLWQNFQFYRRLVCFKAWLTNACRCHGLKHRTRGQSLSAIPIMAAE